MVLSKAELLQRFAEIINLHDPMSLRSADPTEYESEALSILSRFAEACLEVTSTDQEEDVSLVAGAIVKQAFEFWFDSIAGIDLAPTVSALLKAYLTPDSDLADAPEVG